MSDVFKCHLIPSAHKLHTQLVPFDCPHLARKVSCTDGLINRYKKDTVAYAGLGIFPTAWRTAHRGASHLLLPFAGASCT